MKRRLNNFLKSTAALTLAGVVALGGGRTVFAEPHTYTWTVYNNGPGAVRQKDVAQLPYVNSFSHYAKADSFTSTSQYNNVKVTGYSVYLYDVVEGCNKEYYRLSNTTSFKHFRPYLKPDATEITTIIELDTTHCFGTYAMTGRIWY